jgi:hypothetical protein
MADDTRELIRLARKISTDLATLTNALQRHIEATTEQIQAQQQASNEQTPPNIQVSPIEVHFPPEKEDQDKAHAAKIYSVQLFTFIVGLLTLVVLTAYTVFTFGQWQALTEGIEQTQMGLTMNRRGMLLEERQTKAAENAAGIARSALAESERALQVDQRAFIVFKNIKIIPVGKTPRTDLPPMEKFVSDKFITCAFQVQNIGKTPALRQYGFVGLNFIDVPDKDGVAGVASAIKTSFERTKSMVDTIATHPFRSDLAPQLPLDLPASIFKNGDPALDNSWRQSVRILPISLAKLERGDMAVFVTGIVRYDDVFGVPHETDICLIYETDETVNYSFCTAHNTIR